MLSQTGEYALRAVLHLARAGREGPLKIDQIASALGIPRNYLAKILHQLSRDGLLESSRGPTGGFRLAIPPDRLTLDRIVAPFDPIGSEPSCLLGRERCSDDHPCEAHARWRAIASSVGRFFRETTVGELLNGFEASGGREARVAEARVPGGG